MKYKCKKNLVVKVGIKKRKVIWAIKDSTWELDEDSNIYAHKDDVILFGLTKADPMIVITKEMLDEHFEPFKDKETEKNPKADMTIQELVNRKAFFDKSRRFAICNNYLYRRVGRNTWVLQTIREEQK